jgi:quinolinate synthase
MDLDLLTGYEKSRLSDRQPLPDTYRRLSDEDMQVRIAAAKAALGDRLVILGHHYQRDEVIRFADVTGDSLKLAQYAATRRDADFIVFCGVHFMAESANVLGAPHQTVMLPDLAAGCSMADMAAIDQLELAWSELRQLGATDIVPVTYINSAAAIKAFCGEHEGVVCTSSNAAAVMAWAWDRSEKLLMLPDQHLGRNTAYKMGVPLDEMVVWDPDQPFGGVSRDALRHPDGKVIVHPECTFDVVQAADLSGSTDFIIRTISASPEGSVWAVGTEIHLVNRLARTMAPARKVMTLDEMGCLCSTMFRISPNHLLWTLEGLVDGDVHNPIVVPEPTRTWSKVALDRMLTMA